MKQTTYAFIFAASLIAVSATALADDNRLRPKTTTVPPSGYKLDLNTGLSPTNTPAPPPGASTLTRQTSNPFLGLKLTKPLGN